MRSEEVSQVKHEEMLGGEKSAAVAGSGYASKKSWSREIVGLVIGCTWH